MRSHSLVLGNLDLLLLGLSALERAEVAAALETLGGDKALDLGAVVGQKGQPELELRSEHSNVRLGVGLSSLGLRGNLAADDELANVVGLLEVKEATDLGGTLLTGKRGGQSQLPAPAARRLARCYARL